MSGYRRTLAAENERLRQRLGRCSMEARAFEAEEENQRLRRILEDRLGVPDLIRRYRRQLRASQRRVEDLEAALAARDLDKDAKLVLAKAVDCMNVAKSFYDRIAAIHEPQPRSEPLPVPRPEPLPEPVPQPQPQPEEKTTDEKQAQEDRCQTLRHVRHCLLLLTAPQEIGALDAEISVLRAALKETIRTRKRQQQPSGDDDHPTDAAVDAAAAQSSRLFPTSSTR